ncbi:hypothetical protein MPTK1_8g06910 [Marchantia polymorpha subsp. ruderalis]|uniref:Uncharacterized protein n=1 Tax=Marchantia polymorpha TaxID=3197 RepID=A0A2R6XIJ1_MARPO|nr:hypothetical protein MARPO_0013s0101 [Marchantia polymorpha]BBN18970.1 hypothetical protein Mp_8g06910 [Marchantia polymorpha subsp. ruderalis]|eukprot:PTQ45876.1 hypothetical protein MARPO_0013s0101 [Marchantia polymorpha]
MIFSYSRHNNGPSSNLVDNKHRQIDLQKLRAAVTEVSRSYDICWLESSLWHDFRSFGKNDSSNVELGSLRQFLRNSYFIFYNLSLSSQL